MANSKIALTAELLSLIIMVQDYEKFKMSEYTFKSDHSLKTSNFDLDTEKFFNSIEASILRKYGLSSNKISFRKVVNFEVTPEMMSTESADLPKLFTF